MRAQTCSWVLSLVLSMGFIIYAGALSAAPAVLLEKARLVPSDGAPEGGFGRAIAINGDIAVVTSNAQSRAFGSGPDLPGAAYVFERDSSGTWRQTAKLDPGTEGDLYGLDVAVDGNIIVVGAAFSRLTYVYEKQAGTWILAATLGGGGAGNGNGFSVAVDSGLIGISHSSSHGMAIYRRGSSGWVRIASYDNGVGLNDDEYFAPNVDISATAAIHGSWGQDSIPIIPAAAFVYAPTAGGNWAQPSVARITNPSDPDSHDGWSRRVAIAAATALIEDWVFARNASGQWVNISRVTGASVLDDDEVTILGYLPGFRYVPFYRRNSANVWPLRAELTTSDSAEISSVYTNIGRALLASYPNPVAYVVEAPQNLDRPALVQDDFQDGDATGWSTTPGSLFAVASSGTSRFYRQTSTAGNATALWQGTVTNDQSIQADLTPRAFDGTDRWFGLVTRYTDINNYYYVTVRSTGTVQLKRILAGAFITLGSAALPVAIGTPQRIRLEAVGDHVRVFVNERAVIRVRDSSLSGGRPGLITFKTRADFDNIVLNANPAYTAFADDFEHPFVSNWQSGPGVWTRVTANGSTVMRQSDVTGGARQVMLGAAFGPFGTLGDQIVQADLRPTQFSGTDRWVGLIARFRNDTNYHYLTLRNSGSLDIKKLVNGSIQNLATVPFTVQPNVSYRVRFEAVGTRLRAYVNGTLRAEVTDATLKRAVSSAGVATFKAAVDVDNFSVMQP